MTHALVLFSAVTAIVVSISAIGSQPAPNNSKWPEIHPAKTSRVLPGARALMNGQFIIGSGPHG